MAGRPPAYHYPGYPTSDTELITVQYPAAWVPFVTGIISEADYPDLWDSPPDDLTDQLSNLQYLLAEPVTMSYPKRVTLLPIESTVISGNPLTLVVNTSGLYGGFIRQNPAANLDRFTQSFFLAAGTYKLHCYAATSATSAKLQISIDDSELVTEDFYTSTTILNTHFFWQFTVDYDGVHILDCVANGKNASSSGYAINIHCFFIAPTSDI